jgi:nucleoside-diphosphate-sugar epimerase
MPQSRTEPHRKLLDVSKLTALGWRPRVDLVAGIPQTYDWYRDPSTCKWLEGPVAIGARAAGG